MSKVKKASQKSDMPRQKYQVLNWPEYNNALKNRGNITLYFSDEAIDN